MENVKVSKRVKAYILDLTFIILVVFPLITVFILVINGILFTKINVPNNVIMYITIFISLGIYPFFKDFIFKEGSIGNKIMKIQIIDIHTGKKPRKLKLMARNIFFPSCYLEFFCAYIRLDRKTVSDLMTDTRVVYKNSEQ